jgi:hypothetical protein
LVLKQLIEWLDDYLVETIGIAAGEMTDTMTVNYELRRECEEQGTSGNYYYLIAKWMTKDERFDGNMKETGN